MKRTSALSRTQTERDDDRKGGDDSRQIGGGSPGERTKQTHSGSRSSREVCVAVTVVCSALVITLYKHYSSADGRIGLFESTDAPTATSSVSSTIRGLRPIKERSELGELLEEYNFTTGIEVGVQTGFFSRQVLSKWSSCERYNLVDLWAHQDNYTDFANVDDAQQNENYEKTQKNLKQWNNITRYFRMTSLEAAERLMDGAFDFVYIDARHDYCGVMEDLIAYWPKVRPGGIMAGHDFLKAEELTFQDWSLCSDGSRHPGAVRGAVEEFMLQRGLTISVAYNECTHHFRTWMVQKTPG